MQNVGDVPHGCAHHRPVPDAAPDYFQPLFGLQKPVMTQGTNAYVRIGLQNASDEVAATLPAAPVTRICFVGRAIAIGR